MIGDLLRTSPAPSLSSSLPPLPVVESRVEQLERQKRQIVELQGQIEHLTEQRNRRMLEDDVARADQLDTEIAAVERKLKLRQARLPVLARRLREETEGRREQAKVARLTMLRARLKDRTEAAKAVDAALLALEQALAAHQAAHLNVTADWPADLFPDRGLFGGASNLVDRICRTLGMPHGSYVRLQQIARRVGSVAEADQQAAKAMTEAIKEWPLPAAADVEAA